jgi:hypothetical protein
MADKPERKGGGRFGLDRLLDIVAPEVEETGAPPVPTPAPVPPPRTPPAPAPVAAPQYVAPPTTGPKPEAVEKVRRAALGTTPTAYTRLFEVADKMRRAIPDESTRLKAAIETTGISADDIQSAVAAHLATLQGNRQAFERTVAQQRAARVDSNTKRRQEIVAETRELEERLALLRAEDSQLETTIAEAEQNIAQGQSDYEAAAKIVEAEINGNGTKITQYIAELAS